MRREGGQWGEEGKGKEGRKSRRGRTRKNAVVVAVAAASSWTYNAWEPQVRCKGPQDLWLCREPKKLEPFRLSSRHTGRPRAGARPSPAAAADVFQCGHSGSTCSFPLLLHPFRSIINLLY